MITLETSFVVRTFFFVIFGFTIVLSSLLDLKVWLVSLSVIAVIYGIRFLWFRIFFKKNVFPDTWLAPRGLITILLFYSIPENLIAEEFNQGILLLVILISSLAMAYSLIRLQRKKTAPEPEFQVVEGGEEDALSEN